MDKTRSIAFFVGFGVESECVFCYFVGVGVSYQMIKSGVSKPKMTLGCNVILTSLLVSQTLKISDTDYDIRKFSESYWSRS